MGVLVYILGRSGTGKSYSMRNFKKDEIGVINVQGKILPFKGSGKFEIINTDDSSKIVRSIEDLSKRHKTVVVDDFQYVMANEFMRRSDEKGWDKFTDIARHAWDIANCVQKLPNDVIVYVMCHTDTDQDGFEKLKTIGKLLDEKIVLEGMSTIVLKTGVTDGHYMFFTQNNGKDTAKSPAGMFPAYAIDNDLKYVDEKIRSYYEIGDFIPESEMKEKDAAVAHDEVAKEEPKKRRGSRGKKEEEKPTETPEEKTEAETAATEEPARKSRRVKNDLPDNNGTDGRSDEEPAEKPKHIGRRKAAIEEIVKVGVDESGESESVPFEEVETPEPPKRKGRKKAEEPAEEPTTEEPTTEEAPKRRRRRG